MSEDTAAPTPPARPAAPRKPVVTDLPPSDIAVVQGRKFPPDPSPAQLAAKQVRKDLGHVLEAVMADGMRRLGASLFVAHMATDLPKGAAKSAGLGAPLGYEATRKLKPAQVAEYCRGFRANYPSVWGAASSGNAQGMVRQLRIYGLRCLEGDHTLEEQIVHLQTLQSKLSSED